MAISESSRSTESGRSSKALGVKRRSNGERIRRVSLDALDGFEQLVARIMIRFMGDCSDLDALLQQSIAEVGQFLKLDHLVYLDVDVDAGRMMPRCKWAPSAEHTLKVPDGVDVSQRFEWLTSQVLSGERLIIRDVDDLPDSAADERRFCEDNGLHSFAFLPAMHDDILVGAISLDNWDKAWVLDESTLQRLQFVAAIFASAVLRDAALDNADESEKFEKALFEISTTFVNLAPDAVNQTIKAGLARVAEALAVDFAALIQASGPEEFLVTHEWSPTTGEVHSFEGIAVHESFPWLAHRLAANEVVAIESLSGFPEEALAEREATKQPGFEAVLWVPFEIQGTLAGYLAVSTVEARPWPEEIVYRLRALGEVFGEALERRRAELKLRESYDEIRLLKEKLEEENVYLRQKAELTRSQGKIIGDSDCLRGVLARAEQVAATNSTVLIHGETGTGKELLANWIHAASSRKNNRLVKVNCAALPSSLVEAELFGREKGAFTGAITREPGRFEMADGATLFLDEIGELPLELQAKLLRVLQDGEFERLGSSTTRRVDVRVLVATNRDLKVAVASKEFREDLFYRLNVFPIEVPPLRKRISDVPQLVWSFVQEFSESMGKTIEKIPRETMSTLMAHSWPGNVRELRNVIERAMIVSHGPTLRIDRPEESAPVTVGSPTRLVDLEREHIETIVESTGWRISGDGGAAEILGLKPTTLEARMKKLGILRPQRH